MARRQPVPDCNEIAEFGREFCAKCNFGNKNARCAKLVNDVKRYLKAVSERGIRVSFGVIFGSQAISGVARLDFFQFPLMTGSPPDRLRVPLQVA